MRLKSFVLLTILMTVWTTYASAELKIAVAANIQYTFEELQFVFEKETGIAVTPIIGSSGKFIAQIENGAPFDVFLSADMDYPKALAQEGLTVNEPRIYAYGALVIWTMTDADISMGIEALDDPSIKKVAIASPKTAPYGRQAVNALKFYQLYPTVNKKLVYGESIAQASQFITTGAADAGITAKSVVLAPNMKDKGKWMAVDKEAYEPIAQGVVILKYAEKENLEEAQKFFNFLFSDQAGAIFKKYCDKIVICILIKKTLTTNQAIRVFKSHLI